MADRNGVKMRLLFTMCAASRFFLRAVGN
jgi:hypothetical protein